MKNIIKKPINSLRLTFAISPNGIIKINRVFDIHMKKSLLVLATLGLLIDSAQAQSRVTLYGLVDTGLVYTSNTGGKSAWQLANGNEQGPRWGLQGNEDLGGGLKAVFRLENGFNITNGMTGVGGREFGRQAYVGLQSSDFGTITMGRQYTAIQDFIEPLSIALVLTQFATHPYDNDNLNNSYRADNSVKYTTQNIAGFQAEALYGFSNSTNFANNRTYSFGAMYANGPFNLGTGYARLQNPGVPGGAIVANPSVTGTLSNPNAITSQRVDQWSLAGTYIFGSTTIGLLYTGSLYTNPNMKSVGSMHFQNYEASLRYQATPALILAFGETYTTLLQSGTSGHFLQTNTGARYFLSKSTDLYVNAIYQHTSKNLHADISNCGASNSTSQIVVVTGIRHKF